MLGTEPCLHRRPASTQGPWSLGQSVTWGVSYETVPRPPRGCHQASPNPPHRDPPCLGLAAAHDACNSPSASMMNDCLMACPLDPLHCLFRPSRTCLGLRTDCRCHRRGMVKPWSPFTPSNGHTRGESGVLQCRLLRDLSRPHA
jgi:hypothetical protein